MQAPLPTSRPTLPSFRLSEASPFDHALIRDSWRRSYRSSPGTAKWPDAAYDAWISTRLDALLPLCRISVARHIDSPDGLIGWLASEQRSNDFVAHYAWVAKPFRGAGVLRSLIEHQTPVGERVISTLRPPFSDAFKALGFRFEARASHSKR
jgi:hypothetical protein